jgi:hypothetical protein
MGDIYGVGGNLVFRILMRNCKIKWKKVRDLTSKIAPLPSLPLSLVFPLLSSEKI